METAQVHSYSQSHRDGDRTENADHQRVAADIGRTEWAKQAQSHSDEAKDFASAPDEQFPTNISNEIRERKIAEMARSTRSKSGASMSDLTSSESDSFFGNTTIRYNPNSTSLVEPSFPSIWDGAAAQGISFATLSGQGSTYGALTAPGISLELKDEEDLHHTMEQTKAVGFSEAMMREMLWDFKIFKRPAYKKWWELDVRVLKCLEHRMQTIKVLDLPFTASSTASTIREKGHKRGQKAINPPGTITRFPSHIISASEVFLPISSMPNIQLPAMDIYITFHSVYLILDQLFLRNKDRKAVFNLPVARLFRYPENDDFYCCPYLLIEMKAYPSPTSFDNTMNKAVRYLTLNASAILFEWLKLLWLGSKEQAFLAPEHLELHMFAAVGHTVRYLLGRIRLPEPQVKNNMVRYETLQVEDYDLADENRRLKFNFTYQRIHAFSHVYANLYKEAICKAIESGIDPQTTESDDICFEYIEKDGEIFYTMTKGRDLTHICFEESDRFVDESGEPLFKGSSYTVESLFDTEELEE